MNTTTLFGKKSPVDRIFTSFFNRETTNMVVGQPVCLALDGTGDGVEAVHPATAGANKCKAHCIGVATQIALPSNYGIAQTWGLNTFVRCGAAITINTCLIVNSATNDFGLGATEAVFDAVASVGPATLPFAITAIATATVNGVANVSARAFLRFM